MKLLTLILITILLGGIVEARPRQKKRRISRVPVEIIKDYGNGRFNVEEQLPELLDFLNENNIKPRVGQRPIHNVFGLEHLNALDVGVSPKSSKGRRLLQFLKSKFIPFLAISGRKKGVSTGPHIHIGLPSPRTGIRHPVGTVNGKFNHVRCPVFHSGAICF